MNDDSDETARYFSAPCSAHEQPVMDDGELAARLTELLEGERAGARGLVELKKTCAGNAELASLLDAVGRDEARFCVMLRGALERLGTAPSRKIGVFYHKLQQREGLPEKLKLLDRGQRAVVHALDELLPRVRDRELALALEEMRETHVRNIELCAAFLPTS